MEELSRMHCIPETADTPRLTEREVSELKRQLQGWETHTEEGELRLKKSFKFADFKQAMAFTNQVGKLANEEDHHPALLTEWGKVTVTWWTHKIKGLHKNDFIMAAKTDQLIG